MYEAHPAEGPWPDDFPGHSDREIEAVQLPAFEAGVADWWLVVPSPPGAPDGAWSYADE